MDNLYYGIDLGTTNSSIAVVRGNSAAKMIPVETSGNDNLMPSCVMWTGEGRNFIVGSEAYQNRANSNVVYSAKRDMGTNKKYKLKVGTKILTMTPEEVSAEILKSLVEKANSNSGYAGIKNVVITVPAYFTSNQMEATKTAASLAGLNLLKLTKEPTAAALCVLQQNTLMEEGHSENILVYDLGGGTFDLSLVNISAKPNNQFAVDVIATDGNPHLGGDDINLEILNIVLAKFQEKGIPSSAFSNKIKEAFLLAIDIHKKAEIPFLKFTKTYKKKKFEITITKKEVEDCYLKIIEKSGFIIERLLDSNPQVKEISKIIPVGGVTKAPILQSILKTAFKQTASIVNANEAVTLGAAIESAVIQDKGSNISISDVLPIPICLQLANKSLEVLIKRNTKLPHVTEKTFSVSNGEAEELRLFFYQALPDQTDNTQLGTLSITRTPKDEPFKEVHIRLILDSNGILTVEARTECGAARVTYKSVASTNIPKKKPISRSEKQILKWKSLAYKKEDQKLLKMIKELEKYLEEYENAGNDVHADIFSKKSMNTELDAGINAITKYINKM